MKALRDIALFLLAALSVEAFFLMPIASLVLAIHGWQAWPGVLAVTGMLFPFAVFVVGHAL